MPKRPRSHELETLSRQAFERAIGSRRVYRREDLDDYGIDGSVEEFDENGNATGLRYFVQLKATDATALAKALAVGVSFGTAAYYRSLRLPVLMVRYVAGEGALYARWFHQYDPYGGNDSASGLRFRWGPEDRVGEHRLRRLSAEAAAFFEIRSASLALPLDVHLDAPADGVFGLAPAELLFALRSAERRRDDVLRVRRGPAPGGVACVTVRADRISVGLGEVTRAVLHLPDGYRAGEAGALFAADAMIATALALDNAGQCDAAARLATEFLPSSSFVEAEDTTWRLASAFIRARRLHEALRLADALDALDNEDARAASFRFLLAVIYLKQSLARDELEAFDRLLTRRIDAALAHGRTKEAAVDLHNLANVLRTTAPAETSRAVELFEQALICDPNIGRHASFHRHRAGALMAASCFVDSAEAYREAARLGSDPDDLACAGVASLFAGRFAEARTLLRETIVEAGDPTSEQVLFARFADILVQRHGLIEQVREPERAGALIAVVDDTRPPREREAAYTAALHGDALSAAAWWGLAQAHLDLEDSDDAVTDGLAAALCRPDDGWGWAGAFTLTLASERTAPLGKHVLEVASRRAPDTFRRGVARWARLQPADFPADTLLAGIDQHLEDHAPPRAIGLMMRSFADGEVVYELVTENQRCEPPDEDNDSSV